MTKEPKILIPDTKNKMIEAVNIRKILFEDKFEIDARIGKAILKVSNGKLRAAAAHILGAGGKRIRPALVMTVYKAVGGNDINKAASVAAAMELVHNWTLIHDDIIDNSETRRNVLTVHKRWDETVAILSGDMLNNLAYNLVAQSEFEASIIAKVLEQMTTASMQLVEGELMDVEFETRMNLTEQHYFKMIKKKTGSLFSMSAKIGAILGTWDEAVITAMEKYGEMIGLAFQVQDDLLDIIGNGQEFGKEIGKDIKEGKKTLMVLHALSHATANNKERLEVILTAKNTPENKVNEAINIMREAGSLEHARQVLDGFVEEAEARLKALPATPYRMALAELAYFIASRTK